MDDSNQQGAFAPPSDTPGNPLGTTLGSPWVLRLGTRDLWFNAYLTLTHDKTELVEAVLLPRLLGGEDRKRKRRKVDFLATLAVACTVIANALKADQFVKSRSVFYSRHYHTYHDELKGLYYPKFMGSKLLSRLIDQLEKGNWLVHRKGTVAPRRRRRDGTRPPNRRSTFRATEKLLLACQELGISHTTTVIQNAAPVLILKNKQKKPIFYNPNDHRPAIIAVRAVNRFLAQQTLTLNLPDNHKPHVQYADEFDDNSEEEDWVLDFSKARLRRIFNNSDWKQGGRFYGGWWQYVPREWRPHILINGQPTTELDYSGFLLRAIYHSKQMEFRDDPYDVPAIRAIVERNGDDWDIVRPQVKRATQALIYSPNYRQHISFSAPIFGHPVSHGGHGSCRQRWV